MSVVVKSPSRGMQVVTWSEVPAPYGTEVTRNKKSLGIVGPGVKAYTDDSVLLPGDYVYGVRALGAEAAWTVFNVSAPPPVSTILAFYDDTYPTAGVDTAQNGIGLASFLSTGGRAVTCQGTTTYSGGGIGTFEPLNGVTPPDPWYIFLALGLGDGSAYTAGGSTLLSQCQTMASEYTGLFQRCLAMVGPGHLVTRVGYEWNGNWSSGGYPSSGVGNFVLYPTEDAYNAIEYVASLQKAVDATSLCDFNCNGNGPDNQLDQFGNPAIDRCPMNVIDIISVDNYYNGPGTSAYGVGHVTPWIDLAQANGKHWAVPEYGAPSTADGVLWFNDEASLIKGLPTLNRQSNAVYTPFEPAFYHSWFSTTDNGSQSDLSQGANSLLAGAFTAAYGQ